MKHKQVKNEQTVPLQGGGVSHTEMNGTDQDVKDCDRPDFTDKKLNQFSSGYDMMIILVANNLQAVKNLLFVITRNNNTQTLKKFHHNQQTLTLTKVKYVIRSF